MPAKYEAMRDKFFSEAKANWKKRNPEKALSSAKKRELYDQAQEKAARIFNSQRKPGEKPVSGQD